MPSISACLIVRDEQERLPACLASLAPYVDELCVLDTGSTDRTVQIAREAGARVGERPWDEDFAAARNASLELATGEWVLVVDADERLDPTSAPRLREATGRSDAQAFLVTIANLDGSGGTVEAQIPRLFRRRPEIRFHRRVHESVMDSLAALGADDLAPSGVRLLHEGYLPAALADGRKRARNLALMRRARADDPGDLYNLYKLAQTLTAADEAEERTAIAAEAWRLARALSPRDRARHPFLPLVAFEHARCEMEAGRPGIAAAVLEEALAAWPAFAELSWLRGELARRVGRWEEARRELRAARGASCEVGLAARDPAVLDRRICTSAVRLELDRVDPDAAAREAAAGLARHAGDRELRALLARARVVGGDLPGALGELDALSRDAPADPHALLLGGEIAWYGEDRTSARALWEGPPLEDRATREAALVQLALADLAEGRLEQAAERRRALAGSDLEAAAARLLLAAVAGKGERADPAFERDALLRALVGHLERLVADRAEVALAAFSAGAGRLEEALPGIAGLLV